MRLPPARDGNCVVCGQRASNWHHRLPRSRGGPDDLFNCVRVCGSGTTGCHGAIHANPEQASKLGLYVEGFLLRGVYTGPNVDYRREYRGAA